LVKILVNSTFHLGSGLRLVVRACLASSFFWIELLRLPYRGIFYAVCDNYSDTGDCDFLKVPSDFVPHEFNYVLNPYHQDSARITVIASYGYQYDVRYKHATKI
jgi:hypothetical protein